MSQQINLISPLLLKKRYAFGMREMALALGLILAGALAWAAYLHYEAGALEARAAGQEAKQAVLQQEVDRMAAVAGRPVSALLTERVRATQAQAAQREALLATIRGTIETASTGFSPRLRALAQSRTEGVWLNGFTLAPGRAELRGSALNAGLLATYMDRLGTQPPFAGMPFSGMNAMRANPAGASHAGSAGQPAHIDFALYSGGSESADAEGNPNGQ